ncbi:MAG TPA: 4-(cytidine 5'-diphospho)-2-C-methyl-D-erythritol kinase [Acidobacteriaceae bacterium]|nr:4-(cytidine 5'-diphospho)-2-C-methyl-D-erythritol kinase [Acidobacteriaceae bacterium]
MAASIRSHAKINLGLAIGPVRPDGFHALTTVYQTLATHDVVTVEARPAAATAIQITSNSPRVPLDSGNTAWRMVDQALTEMGVAAEVEIHIEKRLPVQGGLGGGSANAVAALIGLERALQAAARPIPPHRRLELAGKIGSDVPLFLIGGAVLGRGHGEEVFPLPEMPAIPCVVALPETGVSTPQAFRDWDALQAGSRPDSQPDSQPDSLTGSSPSATIETLSRSIAAAFGEPHSSGVLSLGEGLAETPLLALVRTGIENDFERVVFTQYPFLGEIKRILLGGSGTEDEAIYAALSGSGSALFGLYRTTRAGQAALERLRAHGVPGLLTSTLPRLQYWREMVVE